LEVDKMAHGISEKEINEARRLGIQEDIIGKMAQGIELDSNEHTMIWGKGKVYVSGYQRNGTWVRPQLRKIPKKVGIEWLDIEIGRKKMDVTAVGKRFTSTGDPEDKNLEIYTTKKPIAFRDETDVPIEVRYDPEYRELTIGRPGDPYMRQYRPGFYEGEIERVKDEHKKLYVMKRKPRE